MSEGAAVYRRNKVLAETGGAVSALTPEVSTLCYVNPGATTGGGKVRQHRAPFNQKETRMSVVDMVILVLKLIVAVLQLLDAVLKYVR